MQPLLGLPNCITRAALDSCSGRCFARVASRTVAIAKARRRWSAKGRVDPGCRGGEEEEGANLVDPRARLGRRPAYKRDSSCISVGPAVGSDLTQLLTC